MPPKKRKRLEASTDDGPAAKKWKAGTLPLTMEAELAARGFKAIAGVDEAGRGPLAGPVVAAACVVPLDGKCPVEGIHDSKQLSEEEREELYEKLIAHPGVKYAVCILDEKEIDRINILQATMKAMHTAVSSLPVAADYVLVDGPRIPADLSVEAAPVVKGDARVYSIAAASIIAKVTRDRIMVEYDAKYPQYLFAQHKGYGTAAHMALIHRHGPCPIHRRTFAPMKHMIKLDEDEEEEDEGGDQKKTPRSATKAKAKAKVKGRGKSKAKGKAATKASRAGGNNESDSSEELVVVRMPATRPHARPRPKAAAAAKSKPRATRGSTRRQHNAKEVSSSSSSSSSSDESDSGSGSDFETPAAASRSRGRTRNARLQPARSVKARAGAGAGASATRRSRAAAGAKAEPGRAKGRGRGRAGGGDVSSSDTEDD